MPVDYDELHRKTCLPCVRIKANKAGGSGTVIYSQQDETGDFNTYIITNHHVVASCIKVKDKWSQLLQSSKKGDSFESVSADFFRYKWMSRHIGGSTVICDVVAYDVDEDIALVRSRSIEEAPSVAILYPQGKENKLQVGMKVIAVGAALGSPPVHTEGVLSVFGVEIDQREFWLNTASIIYGNSGGALFLADTYELIGIPARVAVTMSGFSADAITHLGYEIPITRIYEFLEAQYYRFIYDPAFTEKGEEDERARLRVQEEYRLKGMQGQEEA